MVLKACGKNGAVRCWLRNCVWLFGRFKCRSLTSSGDSFPLPKPIDKGEASGLLHKKANGQDVRRIVGQPSPLTHPHLMHAEEVTPGISKGEYWLRRQKLADSVKFHVRTELQQSASRYAIIFQAPRLQFCAPDVPHLFRQDSNFLYLSGFKEPESLLVVHGDVEKEHHGCALFVKRRVAHDELWNGPCAGVDGAQFLTGLDFVAEHSEFPSFFAQFCADASQTAVLFDHKHFAGQPAEILRDAITAQSVRFVSESPVNFVHKLRWVKSKAEIRLLREACRIGSEGLRGTIGFSKPGMEEHVLGAKMDLECRSRGADCLAYPPVIAGGERANIIHYLTVDQVLAERELVLMDAGCEYRGYVSDITRTWPVSGRFTPPQLAVYEALKETQDFLVNYARETRPLLLSDLYFRMLDLLGLQLQRVGLLRSKAGREQLREAVDSFCPHHVSHYLGMDVHDTSTVPRNIPLEPGVCITIEPGLYFGSNNETVPIEFRGMGMRIEDDVLITETGAELLTELCPKSVHDIQSLF